MTQSLRFTLLCLVALFGVNLGQGQNELKLVIDNDAGGDDAMAIFLALLYEKHYNGPQVVGLTTVNGNTNENNVCRNNQRILKVAKREGVKIFRGAQRSMVTTPEAGNYYGVDGLGDSGEVITNLVPPQKESAVQALVRMSKEYKGKLIVACIGPLTNIALALAEDAAFLARLHHLYIGAGHIHDENFRNAEFNAHMDVEAYHNVVSVANPEKLTVLPFSQVKSSLNFTKFWRVDVLGGIQTDIMKAQNAYEKVSLDKELRWTALDPAVIAAAVNPDLVKEYKYSKQAINLLYDDDRGKTINHFVDKKDANVRVIYSMKAEEYKQFLIDVFSADLPKET